MGLLRFAHTSVIWITTIMVTIVLYHSVLTFPVVRNACTDLNAAPLATDYQCVLDGLVVYPFAQRARAETRYESAIRNVALQQESEMHAHSRP